MPKASISQPTRNPDLFPPPTPAQAIDPDFQGQQHYSKWCGRGSIIVVHPKTFELTITPLRCGSWTCHYCGPKKSQELRKRLARSQPNRFITLTCAHPGNSKPAQAEYAIRHGWPNFIRRLRKTAPDLQYFRVIEWQQNGWPHFHVLLRSDYIPKEILQNAWQKYCWPGFVDIKRIKRKHGIPWEIVKYIIKAYKVAAQLDKHQQLFCSSRDFFPPAASGDDEDVDPDRLWTITSLTPDEVEFRLRNEMFAIASALCNDNGYAIAARSAMGSDWLKLLLPCLEDLPWYHNHNNNLPHAPPALRLPDYPSTPAQMPLLMPSPEPFSKTTT